VLAARANYNGPPPVLYAAMAATSASTAKLNDGVCRTRTTSMSRADGARNQARMASSYTRTGGARLWNQAGTASAGER
jgi:hypothetical protein